MPIYIKLTDPKEESQQTCNMWHLLLPKRVVRRRYTEHRGISLSHGVYNSSSLPCLFSAHFCLRKNIIKNSKGCFFIYSNKNLPLSLMEARLLSCVSFFFNSLSLTLSLLSPFINRSFRWKIVSAVHSTAVSLSRESKNILVFYVVKWDPPITLSLSLSLSLFWWILFPLLCICKLACTKIILRCLYFHLKMCNYYIFLEGDLYFIDYYSFLIINVRI